MKTKILIFEDDESIRALYRNNLKMNNYEVILASEGSLGMQLFKSENPDLILLDLGLPDCDGIDIIKAIRLLSALPIIIVSARDEDGEKVKALDAGADDYLTKPFSVDELLARIRVSERRIHFHDTLGTQFENGLIVVDYQTGIVSINQHEMHLTPIEYKLIVLLSHNVGKVLTYNFILKEVWGLYSDNLPALRVFMTSLRKKIEVYDPEHQYIQTHVGIGYRFIKI